MSKKTQDYRSSGKSGGMHDYYRMPEGFDDDGFYVGGSTTDRSGRTRKVKDSGTGDREGSRAGGWNYNQGDRDGSRAGGWNYNQGDREGSRAGGWNYNQGDRDGSRAGGWNYNQSDRGGRRPGGGNDNLTWRSVNKGKKKKKKTKKRRPTGCLLVFILAAALAAIFYLMLIKAFSSVDSESLDKDSLTRMTGDPNIGDYQNIVLFGVDDQDNKIRDRGSRTDSIIVASINRSTHAVKLMSIYRDTYVSIDGQYDKINAAYSYGGPELAIRTINRNLDLDIADYATVNFKALADAVDILGGIELTIKTKKELKNLNDYIGNMNKINGGNSAKFKKTGTYTFDGNQAVAYSRIRYMEGGDHERANHQRLVVDGILKKAKSQPWKIPSLVSAVLPQCKTSLTSAELTKIASMILFTEIKESKAYPFDSVDERYMGIYYGFPKTVRSNAAKAHEYLFGTKDYQVSEELGRISDKVQYITEMNGF